MQGNVSIHLLYSTLVVSTAKRLPIKNIFLHNKTSFKTRIVKEETETLLVDPEKYKPPVLGLMEKLVPKC